MDILLGVAAMVLGLVATFAGLQLFFSALPIIGFVLGFITGGAAVQAVLGDGFLSSATSLIVGLIVGLVFGVLASLWWYAGALLSAGSFGAVFGTAVIRAFGSNSAWLLAIAAAIGFVIFIGVAWTLQWPIYVVVGSTAFVGATIVVSGLLLVLNRIERGDLGYGTSVAIINESWWWTLPWLGLAIAGMGSQLSKASTVRLPEDKWTAGRPQ